MMMSSDVPLVVVALSSSSALVDRVWHGSSTATTTSTAVTPIIPVCYSVSVSSVRNKTYVTLAAAAAAARPVAGAPRGLMHHKIGRHRLG